MSKPGFKKRLRDLESRTIVRREPVFVDRTPAFNKYGSSVPVMDVTKDEAGRLFELPELLTIEQIMADPKLSKHPELEKILKSQAKFIESDKSWRRMILELVGPDVLENSVIVVDEDGKRKRLECEMRGDLNDEDDRMFDDFIFFNIVEWGNTPAQALLWAYIQCLTKKGVLTW
jgi:hypothetical protein